MQGLLSRYASKRKLSTLTIQECTSQVFEGLISIIDERQSWVARWQRLEGYVPGTYAMKVTGTLPTETVASLEDAGIKYIP